MLQTLLPMTPVAVCLFTYRTIKGARNDDIVIVRHVTGLFKVYHRYVKTDRCGTGVVASPSVTTPKEAAREKVDISEKGGDKLVTLMRSTVDAAAIRRSKSVSLT